MSIDIDKGVVILEVPEKQHGPLWRFLNHYSGVVKKYFGIHTVEANARARANSGMWMEREFGEFKFHF